MLVMRQQKRKERDGIQKQGILKGIKEERKDLTALLIAKQKHISDEVDVAIEQKVRNNPRYSQLTSIYKILIYITTYEKEERK